MLVELFRSVLDDAPAVAGKERAPSGPLLIEQLCLLAEQARATDALVIDAHSPVVWGAARPETMLAWEQAEEPPNNVIPFRPASASPTSKEGPALHTTKEKVAAVPTESQRAIALVQSMIEIPKLHRGGKLIRTVVMPEFACVARSFAAIYVVVLVFGGPFDEIAAKQALAQSLPHIEKLVLSLPPFNPSPSTRGAMALRRR